MKHLLRSVVALGILAVPAVAGAQVTGGFRVRFNLPDLVSPPVQTEVAAFATVPLNDVVAFQLEVLSTLQDAESSATTKFDHFHVPLLGRVRFAKGSPVAFLAGPSVGFWTRVDEFAGNREFSVKGFECGYVAAVEMEGDHGVLDWRYTWGLSNIAKKRAPDAGDNGSAKHRVLSFSAGWRF